MYLDLPFESNEFCVCICFRNGKVIGIRFTWYVLNASKLLTKSKWTDIWSGNTYQRPVMNVHVANAFSFFLRITRNTKSHSVFVITGKLKGAQHLVSIIRDNGFGFAFSKCSVVHSNADLSILFTR